MAKVTIYNDDDHGRAIRVVRCNPFSATISEAEIIETSSDTRQESKQYNVRNGEMLIITTAEKDSPAMVFGEPA